MSGKLIEMGGDFSSLMKVEFPDFESEGHPMPIKLKDKEHSVSTNKRNCDS